jgi:hypothetical protein
MLGRAQISPQIAEFQGMFAMQAANIRLT